MKFYIFKFIHNAIVHPMLSLPINEYNWYIGRKILKLHDWTSKFCEGAG